MVTKAELTEALAEQAKDIKTVIKDELDIRISELRKSIVEDFSREVVDKVSQLEGKVHELETKFEQNLQYQRNTNVIISGIPDHVDHNNLEGVVIRLFNAVCYHSISGRDIVATHRISQKSTKVLVKFINRKDASSLLDSKVAIRSIDKEALGVGDCGDIQIDEHLTPFMSNLAYQCRTLKREGKILKTTSNKGIIKILTTGPGGLFKWHDIAHPNDLLKVVPVSVLTNKV